MLIEISDTLRARLTLIADWAMIGIAFFLPWSTSIASLCAIVWLVVFLPTLKNEDVRWGSQPAAGWVPIVLLLFGLAGTLWADVSWIERWKGFDSFLKFLVIPLLFIQFRKSERGEKVFAAYALSCVLLLLVSLVMAATDFRITWEYAVPVRSAPAQSGEFVICMFGLLFLAHDFALKGEWKKFAAAIVIVAAMLADIIFIAAGRTALVTIPILVLLLALKTLNARSAAAVLVSAAVVLGVAWGSSPYLRERIVSIGMNLSPSNVNSSTERLEFARKSIEFIEEAPLFGFGTGSIAQLFQRAAEGQAGVAARATTNPHNQIFAVAIQIGLIGAAVLWAMWIVHLLFFRGSGFAEWIGLMIVAQNIVGSLFNSHLFDFLQGWIYVIGVGVAGGMVLKKRAGRAART